MDLPSSITTLHTQSPATLGPYSSNCSYLFYHKQFRRRLNCNIRKAVRVRLSSEKDRDSSLLNGIGIRNCDNCGEIGNVLESDKFIEVIGIGSRKDAVVDFCLGSPFLPPSFRFWNILVKDSVKVQLQRKSLRKDVTQKIVEAFSALQSCSKAVILVASAAYGSDHTPAIDILKTVKSESGLVFAIILKPFSFEGRRRQNEVQDLVHKLQEHTNFFMMVDTDALLEKDMVTLDEALKTANNAVLMAMNAISILISEMDIKFFNVPHTNVKDLKAREIINILGRYKEAKIGFGAGYSIKTSIGRAIYDCPFLGASLKNLNGAVLCILASSGVIDSNDVHTILQAFRKTTKFKGEIIVSIVHESNLEANLILTTLITAGFSRCEEPSHRNSIFSKLARHFPFMFNLLRKQHPQSHNLQENYSLKSSYLSEMINSSDSAELPNMVPVGGTIEGFGIFSAELQMLLNDSGDKMDGTSSEQSGVEFLEGSLDFSTSSDQNTGGAPTVRRETIFRQNIGPGYHFVQDWAIEGANDSGATSVLNSMRIYRLPIGVKPSVELKDGPNILNTSHHPEKTTENDIQAQPQATLRMPLDSLADAGLEAIIDIYNNASALLKGDNASFSKKKGVLAVRAASMLEAERDSQKKWSPVGEMKYQGGIYRGRCQGGLPEGKGRLSFADGSIYDGMWRCGKRSGLGISYFSNGDVFQGSWREDAMHGKGWFYFHTGDRWFVHFWKGKANGEGRFYSKRGEVFFGHFKDGWRHGHFLCINVNGSRCLEIWDEGVLVSRKDLDSDAAA